MKVIKLGFSFSVLLILLVAVAFTVDGQGKTVNPANEIALSAQGQQSGQFNAPDLTVSYTYNRTGGAMQLSGNVQFGMSIQANYAVVQTFHLGVTLVDAQGNVLGEQGITSAFGANVGDTIDFSTSVVVPSQVAAMVFTYSGQAYSIGRGGSNPTNFWFNPFTK
ncbi:MAG: hypothetical protein WAW37_07100 [Syntrophobacteraceae bacterium]